MSSILAPIDRRAYSLTAALACTGSISYHHCNAHGGQQHYREMRTLALASPAVATPAPNAARPPGLLATVQRARNSRASSAAGPSAPATTERRQSSGPAGAVGSSAPSTQLHASIGSLRAPFHRRGSCPEHPFQLTPSTANQQSCAGVSFMPTYFTLSQSVIVCKSAMLSHLLAMSLSAF